MNPFERGWNGRPLTEAERSSRSSVVWPQGSMASDAVYPLLHEINPQPLGRDVYPFASQGLASSGSFPITQANGVTGTSDWLGGTGQQGLTEAERQSQQRPWLAMTEGRSAEGIPLWPQGSRASDAVYPLWSELCPEPPSDVVYPLLHELNPQPPGREVYPFAANEVQRSASPGSFPAIHTNGASTRTNSPAYPSLLQEPYSQIVREGQGLYPYGVTTVDNSFQSASLYKKAMLAAIQAGIAQQQPVVIPWNQVQVEWEAYDDEVSPPRTGSNSGGTIKLPSTIFPGAYMIDGSFSLNDQDCTVLVPNGEANEYQKVELYAKRKTLIRIVGSQLYYRFALSASLLGRVSVWNPPWMVYPNGTDLEAGISTYLDFRGVNGSGMYVRVYEGNQKIGEASTNDAVYKTLSRDFYYKRFFDDKEYFDDRFPITQPYLYKKTYDVLANTDFYVTAEFSLIARVVNSWKACKLEIFSYRPQLLRL